MIFEPKGEQRDVFGDGKAGLSLMHVTKPGSQEQQLTSRSRSREMGTGTGTGTGMRMRMRMRHQQ